MTCKNTNLSAQENVDFATLKTQLLEFCASLNLHAVGISQFPLPTTYLDENSDNNPCPFTSGTAQEHLNGGTEDNSLCCGIVILFPYNINALDLKKFVPADIENNPHNLSRYTWGEDYHLIVRNYLGKVQAFLSEFMPNASFEIHSDTSPLSDRNIAYNAGLGFFGKNHCLINPSLGSYFVIGTLLTSIKLPCDVPLSQSCLNCNACINLCPGKALQEDRFAYENCKSYITQKKGELSDNEIAIMRKTPLIFGCDVCQDVCPHNRKIPTTPIPEFQNIKHYIDPNELASMTNREFKAAYGNRAFAWRGKAILLRNDSIVNPNKDNDSDSNTNKDKNKTS